MGDPVPYKRKPGRPTLRDSLKLNEIANLCAKTILTSLKASDELVPRADKMRLAGQVYSRLCPKDISIQVDGEIKRTIVNITHQPDELPDTGNIAHLRDTQTPDETVIDVSDCA